MNGPEYWIVAAGEKSFTVLMKRENGTVSRVGTYRTIKKAEAVRLSLVNPIPHIKP